MIVLAMFAFASNGLLCRLALKETGIDAATFTALRLCSGALVLWLLTRQRPILTKHNVKSTVSLFIYAAGFAFAYIELTAATGALLLFGSVQFTMLAYAFYRGERLTLMQTIGLVLALSAVTYMLMPSASSPDLFSATLMVMAGMAWAVYSILGRQSQSAITASADSFILTVPLCLLLLFWFWPSLQYDIDGSLFALCSGAVTSALGYVIWYRVLPHIHSTTAASVQLSVPALTAIAGVTLLGEPMTLELLLIAIATLTGIALIMHKPKASD